MRVSGAHLLQYPSCVSMGYCPSYSVYEACTRTSYSQRFFKMHFNRNFVYTMLINFSISATERANTFASDSIRILMTSPWLLVPSSALVPHSCTLPYQSEAGTYSRNGFWAFPTAAALDDRTAASGTSVSSICHTSASIVL